MFLEVQSKNIGKIISGCSVSALTRDYLTNLYPVKWKKKENILINSKYLPKDDSINNHLFQSFDKKVSLQVVQEQFFNDILPKDIVKSVFSFHSNLDFISKFHEYNLLYKSNLDCSKKSIFR